MVKSKSAEIVGYFEPTDVKSDEVGGAFVPGIDDDAPVFVPRSSAGVNKIFFAPFKDRNYFKTVSFDDVFDRVYESMQGGVYLVVEAPPIIPAKAIYERESGKEWLEQYQASLTDRTSDPYTNIKTEFSRRSDLLKNTFDS